MDCPLRILHLEDNITDSALTVEMLEAGGFSCRVTRVDTQAGFAALLEEGSFDLILADYSLPPSSLCVCSPSTRDRAGWPVIQGEPSAAIRLMPSRKIRLKPAPSY